MKARGPLASLLALACLAGWACAPAAPAPAAAPAAASGAPAAASAAPARTGWDDGAWGRFRSRRFSLGVWLPDGKAWRIDDHRSSWLVATHAASSSSIAVRVFLEDEATNKVRCEARARAEDPTVPRPEQGKLVDQQERGVLEGWDARAFVVTEVKSKPHEPVDVEGHLVVFAAQVRRCLVARYATRARGPGAEAALGARLAEAAEIVRKIELIDELQGPGPERPSSGAQPRSP